MCFPEVIFNYKKLKLMWLPVRKEKSINMVQHDHDSPIDFCSMISVDGPRGSRPATRVTTTICMTTAMLSYYYFFLCIINDQWLVSSGTPVVRDLGLDSDVSSKDCGASSGALGNKCAACLAFPRKHPGFIQITISYDLKTTLLVVKLFMADYKYHTYRNKTTTNMLK